MGGGNALASAGVRSSVDRVLSPQDLRALEVVLLVVGVRRPSARQLFARRDLSGPWRSWRRISCIWGEPAGRRTAGSSPPPTARPAGRMLPMLPRLCCGRPAGVALPGGAAPPTSRPPSRSAPDLESDCPTAHRED